MISLAGCVGRSFYRSLLSGLKNQQEMSQLRSSCERSSGVYKLCVGRHISAGGENILGSAGEELIGLGTDVISDLSQFNAYWSNCQKYIGEFYPYFGPEKGLCAKKLM